MSSLKIMHVIESLGVGGAEQLLAVLLPALKQEGLIVIVAVMREPLDLRLPLETAGVSVHQLPTRFKWNLPGWAWDIARLARSNDIDIIHAHLYFPAVCTALVKMLHLCGAATVVTFHNLAYVRGVNKDGIGLRLKKLLATVLYPAGFDRKIAVSAAVASHYRSSLGLDDIEVIHNPVDIAEMDRVAVSSDVSAHPVLHLVAPGRLVHEKGHTDLLRALAILRDKGCSFRATLAGGGPLQDVLARQIQQHSLAEVVSITGTLDHQTLLELTASADIVVIPSRFEGLGLSAIESMALSKPVVVTAAGGLEEVVEHGVSGIVVPPQDPDRLARALEELMSDSALRTELGLAGRKRVEETFALTLITRRVLSFYNTVLTPDIHPKTTTRNKE